MPEQLPARAATCSTPARSPRCSRSTPTEARERTTQQVKDVRRPAARRRERAADRAAAGRAAARTRSTVAARRSSAAATAGAIGAGRAATPSTAPTLAADDRSERLRQRVAPTQQSFALVAAAQDRRAARSTRSTPTHELDDARPTEAAEPAPTKLVPWTAARRPIRSERCSWSARAATIDAGALAAAPRRERGVSSRTLGPGSWLTQPRAWPASCCSSRVVLRGYVASYQPRVVRNHARGDRDRRAAAVDAAAGAGRRRSATARSTVFGIAPTILVAMILTIAYDQRFAIGIATCTRSWSRVALGQGVELLPDPLGRAC